MERAAITEMDVSVERHRNTLKGLGLGLAIGGGGGALIGLASGDDPSNQFLAFSAGEKAVVLGVLLGGSGAVIGLIAGALSRSDTWAPAEPMASASPHVSIVPFTTERGTGLHLGLSIPVR
jgi:hypothetical protein